MRLSRTAIVAGIAITLTGCEDSAMSSSVPVARAAVPGTAAPNGEWARLNERRIFFGHQSVGSNILDGVRGLAAADPRLTVKIAQTRDPGRGPRTGILESYIGENGDPASKAREFLEILDAGMGEAVDIALFKFCFVDVQPSTDVNALFATYRRTVDQVHARYPGLTLVHVTVPLTTVEHPAKRIVKHMLGRPTAARLNAKRTAYNRLLLAEYGGREPVFDLARIESTQRDGSRTVTVVGRDTVYALAPEYTDDGGHLTGAGQRAAAIELLNLLSRL